MVTLLFLVQSFGVQIPVGLPFLRSLLIRSAGIFYFTVLVREWHAGQPLLRQRRKTAIADFLVISPRIDDQSKGST